ncbi:MAG: M20 family metallopeptidase [Gammaproteobacteria bacterium]|nr:M20 family metallopeptidase [Gammaproteobacteria bacterium]
MDSTHDTLARLKASVAATVDAAAPELVDLSLQIHGRPELLFQEFTAAQLLATRLQQAGFQVERPLCGLETAFRATRGSGSPCVAIMAEYDAIPEIGHGCGHNIIASAALGAGQALAALGAELPGTVVVFGTPAEEGGNGKQLLAERGAFAGIDAAMMIHPLDGDFVFAGTLAVALAEVEFFGRTAHGTMPERGINALDALLIAFQSFQATKAVLPTGRFNAGIITNGGGWVANVPDHTAAQFLLTGRTDDELRQSLGRLEGACQAGSTATGARHALRCDWEKRYRAMVVNTVLGHAFAGNMRAVRPGWDTPAPGVIPSIGATDMGSVSQLVPSIHPWLAIAPRGTTWHTPESAAAAAAEPGQRTVLEGAKAMAMTALDLMLRPELLREARGEFAARR